MISERQRSGVIELHGIRNRQDRSGSGLHPNRLVVDWPVQQMRETAFLQQIRSHIRLRSASAHPSGRPHSDMLFDYVDALLNDTTLVFFPHAAQQLSVGPTVAQYIVATLLNLLDYFGVLVANRRIEKDRGR